MQSNTAMSHALIYIRKSVVRTGVDTLSPERQRELCLAEAKRHGWRVDRNDIYIDARGHLSGRTEQRPAWLAMRQRLAEDGDIAAVIVESLSRASRSVRDFILFVEELASRNIALISLRERFDTSGAMGKAMSAMIAVFNQLESDLASERQTDRIAARKANGRHWGLTPFGCDRKPVTGALRPSEATYQLDGAERRYYDSLYAAYNLYATGQYSQARLADELNAAGWRYRDRSGRPCRWNAQRVRNALILHRLYAGEVPAEGHIKDGRPQEWIKANFEPILPASLCHRVAAVMAERHRLHYPTPPPLAPEPPLAYPLTGLLCCAECGQPLKGARRLRPDGSFDRYYRHRFARGDCPVRRWTPADELERQISALLAALFTLGSLAMTGLPPLIGFISKWYLAGAAVQVGGTLPVLGVAALLISALLTGIYLMVPAVTMYTRPSRLESWQPVETRFSVLLAGLTAIILVLSLHSAPLLNFLNNTARGAV